MSELCCHLNKILVLIYLKQCFQRESTNLQIAYQISHNILSIEKTHNEHKMINLYLYFQSWSGQSLNFQTEIEQQQY